MDRTVTTIKFRKVMNYWPYLVLLIPMLVIVFPLTKPGALLHQDFPFGSNALSPSEAFSTWIDLGSNNNFEFIARLPEIGAGLALLSIGVTPDMISKLMVILVFYLASVSFFIFLTRLFKNKLSSDFQFQLKVAAIVGSLFYAYNIWSIDRTLHWYLWLGYAVLPLFLMSIIMAFQNSKPWKYYLLAVLSWSVAASTPHMLVFFGLIFIGTALYFILKSIRRKSTLIRSIKNTLIILIIFALVNTYWIYPAVQTIRSNQIDLTSTFGLVTTEESAKMFSEFSNFSNVFRLAEKWPSIPATTDIVYVPWSIAGFVLAATAFSALFFRKLFRYALVFSLVAALGIFLVMGSNEPFNLYSILLFKLPILSTFSELFRDPDKWAFLIGIGYSVLLSITTFEVLKFSKRLRYLVQGGTPTFEVLKFSKRLRYLVQGSFIVLIVGSIVIQSHLIYRYHLVDRYSPAILPDDFSQINHFISSIDPEKVVYFPILLYSDDVFHDVVWNNRSMLIPNLYQWSSIKPNLGSGPVYTQNYYRYLSESLIDNKADSISNLVTPFGTSYIIYHNDTRKAENNEFLEKLLSLSDLKNISDVGFFIILKTDANATSISIPDTNIAAVGGLDVLTSLNSISAFNSSLDSVFFLDQNFDSRKESIINGASSSILNTKNALDLSLSFIDDKYVIAPFGATNRHNISAVWSKAGTLDPWHGEFHSYLRDFGMENWDFDYKKGLVITQASGATLDVPFNVHVAGAYDIFARFMKNQRGGDMRVYLDNTLLDNIVTRDSGQNAFVWENIGSSLELNQGKHTLRLVNVDGFNALNIFAALPTNETSKLMENGYEIANNKRNIYLLEAESNFDYSSNLSIPSESNEIFSRGFDFSDFVNKFAQELESLNYLTLRPDSRISTDLDIMKSSNYTLGIHVNSCNICSSLRISVEDDKGRIIYNKSVSAQSQNITGPSLIQTTAGFNFSKYLNEFAGPQFIWQYLNDIYLQEGTYKVSIYSHSQRDIDSVTLYSSHDNQNSTLDDIFRGVIPPPAQIAEYTKIDPTRYIVNITNATRPYILSFAESYDPLWTAYSTDSDKGNSTKMYASIPLYSLINGFYIDRLGDYSITIEFRPQQWLIQGGIISLITIIILVVGFPLASYLRKNWNKFNTRNTALTPINLGTEDDTRSPVV